VTTRLLDFAPSARQAYQSLRGEKLGIVLRQALEQLAEDPEAVRADPRSCRYEIVERQLRQAPEVWGLTIDAPDGTQWLIVWREMTRVIEIGYIGPGPDRSV
jgi:hypothetical protein